MFEQAEVSDIVERTFQTYPTLTFSALVEKAAEHAEAHRIIQNWGYDRFAEMICYGLGFVFNKEKKRYIIGTRDRAAEKGPLRFLHFFNWRYEETVLAYEPKI